MTKPATPPTTNAPSASATRWLLSICFFLSGGAGLVYEVLWSRHLHLLFGSTTESVAAVLSMFMAGLGLGGHLLGRAADRSRSPMRLYGVLEIGVGVFALLTPALLGLAQRIYEVAAAHIEPGTAPSVILKLVLSAVVLIPPATLMGGTLPALVRATSQTGDAARGQVGLLYALNTLGAVLGTLLSGFVLVEMLGLTTSMRLTAVVNIGIGALVYARAQRHLRAENIEHKIADKNEVPATEHEAHEAPSPSMFFVRYAAAGLFVSGATVMLYEVVYTRVLGLVFGVSSYAFSLVLSVFLSGLGIGALVAHQMTKGRAPRAVDFGISQILLGAVAALTMVAVPSVPRLLLDARQLPDLGFTAVLGLKAGLAMLILFPLALVAGLGMPLLLAALATDHRRAGRAVGRAYMVNTVGTLAGSLVTGFVLVEHVGTEGALRIAVVANLLIGAVGVVPASWGARRWVRASALLSSLLAGILALGAARWPAMTFLLSDTRGRHAVSTTRLALESQLRLAPSELLYFAEGREATVGVTAWGDRTLYVNGHPDASDRIDMATQLLLSIIPLVAEPHPQDVLVVGFGSGVSASAAARVPEVEHVDVAELERAVLAASPTFHHVNHDVEHNPRVHLIHDDARSFLVAPKRKYDAIISEPSNPWRAGVAALFTVEFYRSARAALKPGGVFAQWVQLYGLSENTQRMILHTLSTSFPELQVWWLDPGNIVVLGSSAPLAIDRARVAKLVGGEFAADLRRYAWIADPDELYGRFLLGTDDVKSYVAQNAADENAVPDNSDDLPLLEFEAPRGLFEGDGQNALRLIAHKLERHAMLPPLATGEPPSPAALWSSIATMYRQGQRLPEARAACDLALANARSKTVLALAADLAIEAGDLRAAEAFLDEAHAQEGATANPAAEQDVMEMTALLRAKQRHFSDAIAALDGVGAAVGFDGRLGLPRLRALVSLGRTDEALAQAESLLANARLGGEVEAIEAEQVDLVLVELAGHGVDPLRLAALVEKYPLQGFAQFPRQKALAGLYEKAGRPADALLHAQTALAGGALDLRLMEIEARALAALGRDDEAGAIMSERHDLSPAATTEPVRSPLLGGPPP